MALVYSAFSPQSYEPIVLNMASFHPAIRNLTIHVKEDLLRLNSGGLVLTIVDGEAFTVGICQGNHLLYFEDRPVRFAVDGEDVRLYRNKSRSFSPILAPVHVSGIISRADAFRTHGDSVYDDFDSNDSEIVLIQI